MEDIDLEKLNSATKYPSIETYHELDPKNGSLLEAPMHFPSPSEVLMTEKINGASSRIIIMPDGDWFIGSREEIIYACGDRVRSPALSIVPTLYEMAERITGSVEDSGLGESLITTYYLEVYGSRIGGTHKYYTKMPGITDALLFDISRAPMVLFRLEREQISGWRQRGGQAWADERHLHHASQLNEIGLTPRVGEISSDDLPQTIEDMQAFLYSHIASSRATLDNTGSGDAEGIVFRTLDRAMIAKARFEDYARTMRRRTDGKA